MEVVEAFLGEELGGSEVEVGIKLVNHALETQHGKQPSGESCNERGRREIIFTALHTLDTLLQRIAAVESASNFRKVSCFSDEMR